MIPQAQSSVTVEWPAITIPDGPKAQCRRIVRDAAVRHGVPLSAVVGSCRLAVLTACRQEAAWLCARDTTMSLAGIGRALGKDHTTIIWSIRRVNFRTGVNVRNLGYVTPEYLAARSLRYARTRKAARRAT